MKFDTFNEESTGLMTRVMTIYSALLRTSVLEDLKSQHTNGGEALWATVHIVGASRKEGENLDETVNLFSEICNLFSSCKSFLAGKTIISELNLGIHLVLVGPSMNATYKEDKVLQIGATLPLLRITTKCQLYHDYLSGDDFHTPHLIVCFNAGVWGYPDWLETLQEINDVLSCPCVITAYNIGLLTLFLN